MRQSRSRFIRRPLGLPSLDGWRLGGLLACLILGLPIAALAGLASASSDPIWGHLWSTILPGQIQTTIWLMLGVGAVTAFIGTVSAWLVTFCAFPGRALWSWMLLLPLAIPTYLAAYSLGDFFDPAGPVFTLWQSLLPGFDFPRLQSLPGAIIILSFVLYPYVFLSARAAFVQQSANLIEAARSLGNTPFQCFVHVALPMARPAIAVGVALVLMECLNDIGAMEYLGVATLTIGVYDTWVVRGNLAGAAQMALMLLGFMALLIVLERSQRRAGSTHPRAGRQRSLPRFSLSRRQQILALTLCLLPILLGFVLPVYILLDHAMSGLSPRGFSRAIGNSFSLAVIAALVTCAVGLGLAYGARTDGGHLMRRLAQAASLGYAVPGTVLAIGIMLVLGSLGEMTGGAVVLGGTVLALLFAYVVRFLSLAFGTLEAGLGRIPPAMDMAARSLGTTRAGTLRKIHMPLLRAPLLAAGLLVFVDVMKELPATLILRPFDFETLASQVYTYASVGQLETAALPALAIILVGLIPVVVSLTLIDRSRGFRK
jgi:iron(III) transport system permease protein